MKFLICLSVLLAVANAGLLHGNAVYGNGIYSTGNVISASTTYVHSAPAIQSSVHIVRQPVISSVYHSAPLVSSSVVSAPVVHATPLISAGPVLSQSYGLRYGSAYGLGGVLNAGFLKRQ